MFRIAVALAALLLCGATAARAAEDTPHARVLVCYGMAYGVVEMIYTAAENLDGVSLTRAQSRASSSRG